MCFGDAAQACLAATAVLTWSESEPGGDLTAMIEVVPDADAGQDRGGAGWADSWQLHQSVAAFVLPGYFGDGFVVFVDALIQPAGVREHIADAAVGPSR